MMYRGFTKMKLRTVVTLTMLAIFLPVGLALTGLAYFEALSDLEHRAEKEFSQQVTDLSLRLENITAEDGFSQIQDAISYAGAETGLLNLSLIGEANQIIASTRLDWVGKVIGEEFNQSVIQEMLLSNSHIAEMTSNKTIKHFTIYRTIILNIYPSKLLRQATKVILVGEYSYEKEYLILEQRVREKAGLYFTALMISLILIIALLNRLISRPVEQLGKFIANIEQGHVGKEINVKFGNEFSRLAKKLTRMSASLAKTQAGLREAHLMLRTHLDLVPDIIFYKDKEGIYTGCNQAFCRLVGKDSVADVIGTSDTDLFGPERASFFRKKDSEMLAKDVPTQNDEWVEYPDGKKVLLDTIKAVHRNTEGEVIGLIGVSRDITERHQIEMAIQTLVASTTEHMGKDFFRIAAEKMNAWMGSDAIILGEFVDPGQVKSLATIVDGEYVENYQYELKGTPCESVSGEEFCYFTENLFRLFPGNDSLQTLQFESYIGTLITNKEGTAIGILCAFSREKDYFSESVESVFKIIAARAGAEMERNLLENQLVQAQKMEAIGTLAGGIAHDFNNTLAGITGNIYLAKKEVQHLPKTLKRLEGIENLSYQSAGMVQQLLTFSSKDMVNKERMNVTSFLEETINMHRVTIPENIQLYTEVAQVELVIEGDANQLQQVVMNLLNNARDAVKDNNKPEITLKLEPFIADQKFLSYYPELETDTFAHISVKDNGHGIKESCLKRIFEPFYTTKESDQGSGLGLAMVYGSIQSHGGIITVTSQVDEGSTFHIYLPVLANDENSDGNYSLEKTGSEAACGHGEMILLVDDEEVVLEIGQAILEDLGYQVVVAANGLEAVETFQARQDEISLVILDVVMPKMGGIEAGQLIHEMKTNVPIIFLTGYDFSQTLNTEDMVAEVVLAKPFNIVEFSRIVQNILLEFQQANAKA